NIEDKNAPTIAEGEEITGRPEREITLERDAQVVRDKTQLNADTACYKQVEDEVDASGHVRMLRFGDTYTGDVLKLNMDSGQGFLTNPTYKIGFYNGQGKATRIDFINPEEAVVQNGTYSTCSGPNPDWYLKSDTMTLDTGRDVGTAGETIIYFKDYPILGTPEMSFSLSGARRSGWLAPTPGFGSKGAAELTVPYYFNIAPNRDLTLSPKLIPSRGLQIGADGRYMGLNDAGTYKGETYIEYLHDDKQTGTDRWMINSTHEQSLLMPGLTAGWDLHGASDDNYPNDFSKTVAASTDRQLLREFRTDYRADWWSVTARVQNYQVLQDPAAATDPSLTVARPYDRLPDISLHAAQYDIGGGFDWSVDAEATRFWHPTLVRGDRVVVIPQISYPYIQPSYFITPKLMLNTAAYLLDNNAVTSAAGFSNLTPSRAIPTFSLDGGLMFERDAKLFGKAVTQTLEPRLFYVYTPYRDQTATPNFDTATATFNQSQLFSENRFIGGDRVGDANQLTAAVTSRFIEESGAERLRLTVGERFYFSDQRVQLDQTVGSNTSHADLLIAASGRISETWGFDSGVEYSPGALSTSSSNFTINWKPGPKEAINIGYNYVAESFKNIDLSGQWPLTKNWYGVGRISYSLQDKRILESLIGLEYNGGCWVFRMGAQRFVTSANQVSTPVFFQLELNGLSKLGVGNGLDALTKTIPGYQKLNPGDFQ
ncbi:MAG TPA: LPS-assembly protein LptD, partial [Janthinobacterium sp.]|nr:LPS-assembly protein LptD [Janthinobacterium sp.]